MTTDSTRGRVVRTRHRMIAGVAGGFGRYFAIDPNVVRIVLVLLAFAGGIGVLVYLAAWLIVPEEPPGTATPSDAAGQSPQPRTSVAVVVLTLVGLLVITVGRLTFDVAPQTVWAFALIGGGAAVLWLRAPDTRVAPGAETRTAPPMIAGAPSEPWTVAPVAPSPLQRLAPVLGRVALVLVASAGALLVAVIGVLLVEGPGAVNVTPLEAIVTGVLVLAAAVVLGIARHGFLDVAPVVLALLAVLAFAGWIGPPFRGGFGVRDVRPDALVSRATVYRLAGGQLSVDLRDTRIGDRARVVRASVATGRVDVVVPPGVDVDLRAHVDAGGVKAFGVDEGGLGVDRHAVDRVPGAKQTLLVRARVGCGEIVVRRASSRTAQEAVA